MSFVVPFWFRVSSLVIDQCGCRLRHCWTPIRPSFALLAIWLEESGTFVRVSYAKLSVSPIGANLYAGMRFAVVVAAGDLDQQARATKRLALQHRGYGEQHSHLVRSKCSPFSNCESCLYIFVLLNRCLIVQVFSSRNGAKTIRVLNEGGLRETGKGVKVESIKSA